MYVFITIMDSSEASISYREGRRDKEITTNGSHPDHISCFATGTKGGEWIAENEDKTIE